MGLIKVFFAIFKKSTKFLLWILLFLLIISLLLVFTNIGNKIMFQHILPQVGVKAEQIEGSLWDELHLSQLSFKNNELEVEAKSLTLQFDWKSLFDKKVNVQRLAVDEVQLKLLPQESARAPTSNGFVMPQLPVDILVDSITLGQFVLIQADGSQLPVGLGHLELSSIEWNQDLAKVDLNGLEITHDFSTTRLNGDLKLGKLSDGDMPIDLNLYSHNTSNNKLSPLCLGFRVDESTAQSAELECHLDFSVNATGSLKSLQMVLTGLGNGIELNATGRVNVFAPILLEQFNVKVAFEDGTHIDADIQSAMLDDKVQHLTAVMNLNDLVLSGLMPQSKVSAQVNMDTKATGLEQWQTLNVMATIGDGSQWAGEPLSGHVNLAVDLNQVFTPEAVEHTVSDNDSALLTTHELETFKGWVLESLQIEQADIQLEVGLNKVSLKGDLGKPSSVLNLQARLPEMEKVWTNIGTQAEVDAVLKGSLAEHGLQLQGLYAKGDSTELGQAPVQFELGLKGQLSEILQALRWQGEVNVLHFEHLDYQVSKSLAHPIEIMLDTAAPLSWQLGEAVFNLKHPEVGLVAIHHQHSFQQDKQLHSTGSVANLSLENAIYDATWSLNKKDQFQAEATFTRRQDVLAIQKNPLANIKVLSVFLQPKEKSVEISGLEQYLLSLHGEGEQTQIQTEVEIDLDKPLLLEKGIFDIALSNGSVFVGDAHIHYGEPQDTIKVKMHTKNLALEQLSLGFLPSSMLNGDIEAMLHLSPNYVLSEGFIQANFSEDSRWNKQKLSGDVAIKVHQRQALPEGATGFNPALYWVEQLDTHLRIGSNHIISKGGFGQQDDALVLDIHIPRLAEVYPGLSGGVLAKGNINGSISNHEVDVNFGYVPNGQLNRQNKEWIGGLLKGAGGWVQYANGFNGWSGTINQLALNYQDFGLEQRTPLSFMFTPIGVNSQSEWAIGASTVDIILPSKERVSVRQLGSVGSNGQWMSKGEIKGFVLNKRLLDEFNKFLGQSKEPQRGGVVVQRKERAPVPNLIFDANWDITFDQHLKGNASLVRRSGDLVLPLSKPVTLGIQNLGLNVSIQPQQGAASQLKAELVFETQQKGHAKVDVQTAFNGLTPNFKGGTKLTAVGGLKDIAWLSAFTDDLLTLGGGLDFNIALQSLSNGQWDSTGVVTGRELRVVEPENGVRLLNGTLKASFKNNRVILEQLYFPSVMRITPSEWRTRQWIAENPPAQKGSLNASGDWDLVKSNGSVKVVLDHYPIVQRADRFAMMSGEISLDAKLPKIALMGKLTADAGWASIDITDTPPSVDGDVIILKPGQKKVEQAPSSVAEHLSMNLTVDLGPRFYLVGMGLNSGLVGALTLVQEKGRLSAEGGFRTRGGAIEAYGQRLQIARGDIDFSGNITNPRLNIEAVRRGLEVEAGLRVMGTAKKPQINLISYPDVSDVEKLSWLIMGRGPDSSGADLALLFSVGGSLIGGDEPFYRKIGLDEIGVRAGDVGDTDNILPKRTVAESTSYRGYEEANQLFYAMRRFGANWKVSIEQALSGSGTVVRGSYNLMRYLTVDLKLGTVNGIELLYKRVFRD